MAWRDTFLKHFGPGLLGGIALGDWLKLLRENRFTISPGCLPRAMAISAHACNNSVVSRIERQRFGEKLKDVAVHPPLFILGHWRSGTTHLHNLMAVDDHWAYPNSYQTLYPHVFLTNEALNSRLIQPFMPPRRPMDNVEWTLKSPQEDEFAIANATCISPCIGWVFPQRREFYQRFLTLRNVSESELALWKSGLMQFLKKLTLKYNRPLVLKSPQHTCRIRLLLGLFPDARFVHIHRDPYVVFQSSRHTYQTVIELHRVQRYRTDELDSWILGQYREMYDVFFEERSLIPAGRYHEMSFEQLEIDPIGQMRAMYQALDLPDFAQVKPALKQYVGSIAGYQKNSFGSLSNELREQVAERCRPCFEEWGYAV
jgi:omega-hydroxy-beta-dihydromenaquinone-9 sulfotransferase